MDNPYIIIGAAVFIAAAWFFLRPSFASKPYEAPTTATLPNGTIVNNPDWLGMRDCFQAAQDRAGADGADAYRDYTTNDDALENTVTHWLRFGYQYPESCWPKAL